MSREHHSGCIPSLIMSPWLSSAFDPHDTPRVRLVRSAPRAVLRLRCGGSDRLWRTQWTRTGRTADVADDRDCWALSAFRFIRADQRDPQSRAKRFEPAT
jgi:hypothetical protein